MHEMHFLLIIHLKKNLVYFWINKTKLKKKEQFFPIFLGVKTTFPCLNIKMAIHPFENL